MGDHQGKLGGRISLRQVEAGLRDGVAGIYLAKQSNLADLAVRQGTTSSRIGQPVHRHRASHTMQIHSARIARCTGWTEHDVSHPGIRWWAPFTTLATHRGLPARLLMFIDVL
jgi:hypothetical protein